MSILTTSTFFIGRLNQCIKAERGGGGVYILEKKEQNSLCVGNIVTCVENLKKAEKKKKQN